METAPSAPLAYGRGSETAHVPRETIRLCTASKPSPPLAHGRGSDFLANTPLHTLRHLLDSKVRAICDLRAVALGRIIAVANQKGGVGKTTTAINLSASLAAAELQVVLVDCDPQANATASLGFHRDPSRTSLYHLLFGDIESGSPRGGKEAMAGHSEVNEPNVSASLDGTLCPTCLEGLFLIPSERNLAGADIELISRPNREFCLRQLLTPLKPRYEYILLDCPPALNLLTVNALVAADSVLVPIQCEYLALEGISALLDTVERIRGALNPGLELEGILLTMFDERTTLARQVAEEIRHHFPDKVFATTIPRNVRLAEAPSHGQPALLYDVRSRGAEAYIRLAKELIARESPKRYIEPGSA